MPLKEETGTLCLELWRYLNQVVPTGPPPGRQGFDLSEPSFADALQWFAKAGETRTINLLAISPEDAACMAGLGISKAHVTYNLEETFGYPHFHPLGFQMDAVRRGCMTVKCPFSGKPLTTVHSLPANINVMFYRFSSRQVFYLAVAGIGSGFQKSALYFPEFDLVITAGDEWGLQPDDLLELKARMVSNTEACLRYFNRMDKEGRQACSTAVCLGFYHFAHHLWNELPGIERLERAGLLGKVDEFLVLREPLGPLEAIFPEIPASRVKRRRDVSEVFQEILAHGYFAVRPGDRYLSRALAARVAKVAREHCSPGTVATAARASEAHQPLLWLGIRVGNRAWAGQVEGLTELITALQKQFPRLGVVFDGFSLPADRAAYRSEERGFGRIVAREHEVAREIIENLQRRQVPVALFDIVGASVFDANVWAHAISVYLSPYGSLQHKVGWFTNKHGVVHTNRTLSGHPPKYVWEAVEGGVPPRYIDAVSVTDIDSDATGRTFYHQSSDASEVGAGILAANRRARETPEFMNYSIPWAVLHREVADLIRSPGNRPRMAVLVFAHRARRRMRTALRWLAGFNR